MLFLISQRAFHGFVIDCHMQCRIVMSTYMFAYALTQSFKCKIVELVSPSLATNVCHDDQGPPKSTHSVLEALEEELFIAFFSDTVVSQGQQVRLF